MNKNMMKVKKVLIALLMLSLSTACADRKIIQNSDSGTSGDPRSGFENSAGGSGSGTNSTGNEGDKISGGFEGNGGAGWVCRTAQNTISWIEMADLTQAKQKHKVTIAPEFTNASADDIVIAAIIKLLMTGDNFAIDFGDALLKTQRKVEYVNADLNGIKDTGKLEKPNKVCDDGKAPSYIQIAKFDSITGVLQINAEAHAAMDNLNLAALELHEAGFYALRAPKYGDTRAMRTHELVSHMLSDKEDISAELKLILLLKQ